MNLTFTGRGAAFNVKEGNTNAFFVENGVLFMIDCGETMFETMIKNNLLKDVKEVYVVISHTHSDHCGSLGSFGLYSQFVLGKKLHIIAPHNEEYVNDLRALMKLFGNTDNAFEIIYEEDVDSKFEAFNSVRYELTQHDFMLTCYSFVFETNQGAVFYSADTRVVDNLLQFISSHDSIDKIFMEVTDLNGDYEIHLSLDKLNNSITPEIKEYIYMMHFRNDNCKQKVQEYGYKIVEVLS